MAIESIGLSRTDLPEGVTAGYSADFGGSLTLRKDGDLISVGRVGDDEGAFIGAFNGRGREIYRRWKQEQIGKKGEA